MVYADDEYIIQQYTEICYWLMELGESRMFSSYFEE